MGVKVSVSDVFEFECNEINYIRYQKSLSIKYLNLSNLNNSKWMRIVQKIFFGKKIILYTNKQQYVLFLKSSIHCSIYYLSIL